MLSFYILHENHLNESCVIFKDQMPHTISGQYIYQNFMKIGQLVKWDIQTSYLSHKSISVLKKGKQVKKQIPIFMHYIVIQERHHPWKTVTKVWKK
jgi:hypothetical protein